MTSSRLPIVIVLFAGLGLVSATSTQAVAQAKGLPPAVPPIDAKQLLSVPAAGAPSLDATIKRVAAGWDIEMALTNLRFAASKTVTVAAPGEGRVELFVDNRRTAQVFDTKLHVDQLAVGTHEIRLGVYANDGKAYAVDGNPVMKRFIVWVNRFRTAANPKATTKVLDFDVVKGKIAGSAPDITLKLTQGDTLEIRWTVDEPTQLHFHGYDIETIVTPPAPITMLLTADLTGRFSIEKHGVAGAKDTVLQYVEVYP